MERLGRFVFAGGAAVSVLAGVISTLNLGTICALGEGPPTSMLSYPALCFMFWAYGVPLGLILAATGVLMMAGRARGADRPPSPSASSWSTRPSSSPTTRCPMSRRSSGSAAR
jgi:hypothetical protein